MGKWITSVLNGWNWSVSRNNLSCRGQIGLIDTGHQCSELLFGDLCGDATCAVGLCIVGCGVAERTNDLGI